MAATLLDGREYGLSTDVSANGKKTLIHFKLTDSALRALEEYSKIKKSCSQRPTIQFSNNSGVVSIPGSVDERSFKLSLAKIQGNANGSFDCIQQVHARDASDLQCQGSMLFKVTTHANNEVYTDTRKKIAFADNESKKACAKEIKMSSRFKGRAVKKVLSAGQFRPLHPTPKPSPLSSSSSSTIVRPSPSLAGRATPPPPSRAVSPHQGQGGKSVVNSNGVLKLEGLARNRQASGVVNMPYKDRVVHLLALRSYKKPELVARLMKDGIREKDRNCLGAILKQVSVMNKDNSHSLARHAWTIVRPDWTFYTDADRDLLKKNQQLQQDGRVSPSPAVQPADGHSPSLKRSVEDVPEFPIKKQRIAHQQSRQQRIAHQQSPQQRIAHQQSPAALGAKGGAPPSTSDPTAHNTTLNTAHNTVNNTTHNTALNTVNNTTLNTTLNTTHNTTLNTTLNTTHNTTLNTTHNTTLNTTLNTTHNTTLNTDHSHHYRAALSLAARAVSDASTNSQSPGANAENRGRGGNTDASPPEYLTQYTDISSCHQRKRYKDDFNKLYEEYQRVHERVKRVSQKFGHLKERMINTPEGSQEFEELYDKVMEEYERHKDDAQFWQDKERLDFLHGKLGHIKRLITHFDNHRHQMECR